MDIVLEALDTYVFDHIYARAFPTESVKAHPILTKLAGDLTSSFNATEELPLTNAWTYKPATTYFTLEPSMSAYTSAFARDNIFRQSISLFLITWIFGIITYFLFSSLSYLFVFDHATFNHPKFLKHQVRQEIMQTMEALPIMAVLTVPFFLLEVQGYGKFYDSFDDAPFWAYNLLQFPLFVMFTDFGIYWIHRELHSPLLYKRLHKPHHKWIMPSPYASYAFHPLDGWAQSLPYHIYPLLFPLQKFSYVILFGFVNFWTILIHDGEFYARNPVINGAACHTLHHLYFRVNYGQFTTLWDRLCSSYRKPDDELFQASTKMSQSSWQKQTQEMEHLVKEVEGDDDRVYDSAEATKKTK